MSLRISPCKMEIQNSNNYIDARREYDEFKNEIRDLNENDYITMLKYRYQLMKKSGF